MRVDYTLDYYFEMTVNSLHNVGKNVDVKTFAKESSQPWIEKYRPKTMHDVSSQNEIVSALSGDAMSGNLPHLLFYGPPGTGKTSAILALCRDMFGDNFRDRVLELNASDERGIAVVREKVKDFAKTLVSSRNQIPAFKIIILDEADSMTFDAQAALRRIMETYSTTTRFCIICNYVYRIIEPLASRCAKFRFKPISPQDAKNRLMSICNQENLNCDSEALDILIQRTGGDLRKSINYLQSAYRMVQFDKKYVTTFMISDLLGTIPNNIIDTLFKNIQHSSLDELHGFIWNNIIQEGYSLTQLLYQLQESLIQSGLFSSQYKSLVSVKMAHVLKNLMDGADGHLQILDLVSFMHQYTFSKTKGKKSKVDVMNIISSA